MLLKVKELSEKLSVDAEVHNSFWSSKLEIVKEDLNKTTSSPLIVLICEKCKPEFEKYVLNSQLDIVKFKLNILEEIHGPYDQFVKTDGVVYTAPVLNNRDFIGITSFIFISIIFR